MGVRISPPVHKDKRTYYQAYGQYQNIRKGIIRRINTQGDLAYMARASGKHRVGIHCHPHFDRYHLFDGFHFWNQRRSRINLERIGWFYL